MGQAGRRISSCGAWRVLSLGLANSLLLPLLGGLGGASMRSGRDLGRLVGAWHRPCKEQCALVADYDQRSVDVCLPPSLPPSLLTSPRPPPPHPPFLGQIMAQCRLKPSGKCGIRSVTTCAALLIQSSELAYISRASGLGPGISKTRPGPISG